MNTRTSFWLAVFIGGLALWVYLLADGGEERISPASAGEAALDDRLLAWPLARLTSLEFIGARGSRRIERAGGTWQYARATDAPEALPAAGAATAFIVEHLTMLSAARIERTFPVAPAALQEYGIASAGERVLLYVDGQAAPVRTLHIGKRTPDGFGQYVLLDPLGHIVIVPAYHIDNLAALADGPMPAP